MNNTINIGSVVRPKGKGAIVFGSQDCKEMSGILVREEKALVLDTYERPWRGGVVLECKVLTPKGTMGWIMTRELELVE